MGISDGELSPGRSIKLARRPESSTEVSGVPGSDWEIDGGADLLFDCRSDGVDGVDGAVVVGYVGCGAFGEGNGGGRGSVGVLMSGGRWVICSWAKKGVDRAAGARRSISGACGVCGVGLREGISPSSRCSVRTTRVHKCFQISSDSRGPGSSIEPGDGLCGDVTR